MPTNLPEPVECSECGRTKGHSIGCVTGNEQARKYQEGLERKTAIRQLKEIRNCDKCDLCEDHHG